MPIGQYIISVNASGYTHDQALALAAAHGGTLAAVTSAKENNLILGFLAQDDLLWNVNPEHTARFGPWIGLTQTGGPEPAGGWTWDTGEALTYTGWHPTQPDDFDHDAFTIFFDYQGTIGWGDTVNDNVGAGFTAVTSVAVEVGRSVKLLNGSDEHDLIYGADRGNKINGKGGDDLLFGGAGADTINGGAGADTIYGGMGGAVDDQGHQKYDEIIGGAGADHFVYTSVKNSPFKHQGGDAIYDFSHEDGDLIDLSAIDAIPGGAHDPLEYRGPEEFTGIGQVKFFHGEGNSYSVIEVNLSGNHKPELVIFVLDIDYFQPSEFIL